MMPVSRSRGHRIRCDAGSLSDWHTLRDEQANQDWTDPRTSSATSLWPGGSSSHVRPNAGASPAHVPPRCAAAADTAARPWPHNRPRHAQSAWKPQSKRPTALQVTAFAGGNIHRPVEPRASARPERETEKTPPTRERPRELTCLPAGRSSRLASAKTGQFE